MRISEERGSAPVEFLLLGVPMILVSLAIAGTAFLGYQKLLLQDAAIEAAAFGALADQSSEAAEIKAQALYPGVQATAELLSGPLKILKVQLIARNIVELKAVGYAVLEVQPR